MKSTLKNVPERMPGAANEAKAYQKAATDKNAAGAMPASVLF
jgi:hypothetical protein